MQMQRLKLIVGVMSLLILLAMGLVVYGMLSNVRTAVKSADPTPIHLRKDSNIIHMTEINDSLALHVKSADKEEILIIDPYKNEIIIKIPVEHGEKKAK